MAKVVRKGSYQGVAQWGINTSSEITPSRKTAQKWAELENARIQSAVMRTPLKCRRCGAPTEFNFCSDECRKANNVAMASGNYASPEALLELTQPMKTPTIYEALAAKLGRAPSNVELKAEVSRIKESVLVDLASEGKLKFQRK